MPLELKDVSKSFGDKSVIRHLSYTFPERGVVAVTGESGSGKTTLLNMLLGLIAPDSGEVLGRGRMGAVFQEDRLIPSLSVTGNLTLIGCGVAEAHAHLEELGLYPDRDSSVGGLSGGMKRRLAVARAVIYLSPMTALDEPFKGLDAGTRERVAAYILRRCADRLIVLVSHEAEEIRLMRPVDIINLEAI